ncbi:hypothetical protein T484DRAFT_3293641 [Baffinella frigidus]|nr:hypothetical protein T484DRAFT_3293641 [Cryptophyta sp. CCMP2293]
MDEPAAPVTTPAVVEIPDLQENVRQAPSKEPGPLLYPPMAHSAAYTAGQNVAVDSTVGYPVTVSSEGSDADSQGSHRGSVNGSVNGGGILFHGSPREIFGTGSAGDAAALAEPSYWREVARQTHAMVKKNFILARRNRFSTFLRVFVRYPQGGSRLLMREVTLYQIDLPPPGPAPCTLHRTGQTRALWVAGICAPPRFSTLCVFIRHPLSSGNCNMQPAPCGSDASALDPCRGLRCGAE